MTMTMLFREDAYLQSAEAEIVARTPEGGLVVDRALFYPTGGGQPGDSGRIEWGAGRVLTIADTVKGDAGGVVLIPAGDAADDGPLPAPGTVVTQRIDWARRWDHMRVHTALHLLSVVVPLPVTGGQIGAGKGRLDFDMPEPIEDVDAVEAALNDLVARDLAVTETWITDAELDANPTLVKTMSVRPPRGQGRVRLIRIGTADEQVDLQPCGGTHVARTGEIGPVHLGKLVKKGRRNRRIALMLGSRPQN